MATNTISDGEITPELNEKPESASSSIKEESNIVVGDSLFHLLDGRWTFWYTHRPTTFRNSSANYDSCLKKLGLFSSILSSHQSSSFFFRYIRFDRRILVLL